MLKNFDAIVIGASVMETSIAFHLTERNLKPHILERKQVGFGATGRTRRVLPRHWF